ncbi:MAG: tetratricopeptide repeat protein [Actinomycetota bacterium]|nr:tetratricopeptide repeat protein [Actinomycetota bacterium]
MSAVTTAQKTTLTHVLLVLCVAFIAYSGCLANGFAGDDNAMIINDHWIRSFSFAGQAFFSNAWGFDKDFSSYYRPLQQLAYMFFYAMFGLKPLGWHLANIALHAINSTLVYFIALQIIAICFRPETGAAKPDFPNETEAAGQTRSEASLRIGPLAAALIFAAHPIHVDAVASPAVFPDLLAAFFSFTALLVFIRRAGRMTNTKGYAGYFAIEFSLLLAAFLSKEPALTMPFVFVAYDVSLNKTADSMTSRKQGKPAVRTLVRYAPSICAMAVYSAMRLYALGGFGGNDFHPEIGLESNILSGVKFFALYLLKTFVPYSLNAGYDFRPVSSLLPLGWQLPLSAFACGLFVFFLYASFRRPGTGYGKGYFFSGLFFALPLLPALDLHALIQFFFAERYLYIPLAGFSLALGIFFESALNGNLVKTAFPSKKASAFLIFLILTLLIAFYGASTFERTRVWKNNYSLWADIASKSPDNGMAHFNYGDGLKKEGKFDEAIAQYRESIKLIPYYMDAYISLGDILTLKGDNQGAAKVYEAALSINSGTSDAPLIRYNLARAYQSMGKIDAAIGEYRMILQERPDPVAYRCLADLLCRSGNRNEAKALYRKALKLDPMTAGGTCK